MQTFVTFGEAKTYTSQALAPLPTVVQPMASKELIRHRSDAFANGLAPSGPEDADFRLIRE